MNQKPPRVWISNATPKKGEVLRVRAQIEHVMESGLRQDEAGKIRPRNIVTRFEAHLGTALLFAWEPGISISQNPYIEFTFLARESGELRLHWKDDAGQTASASKAIAVV
ncbi:MAG: thiosulfate oxidation carrier complex protein SoxZ [Comamonadaceae bacterium SCN 68-20]|nr:thiosulfate oxidation carrier complex protein SoxZ [Comamonadaceae bacterium]ODU58847.1 MAG: thiosulfate oxidation carrier complex protein SoxZ [Comamonadaceae bacterium SCN 68-20]OJX30840.1 MAG: thiosulfate oxidation carrier complex protein SoxZ [Burkholderiales bacterium 68-20]